MSDLTSQSNRSTSSPDPYTPIISRYMRVDEMTWGTDKQGFLLRYRGQLLGEASEEIYDAMAAALQPLDATPLFRIDHGLHAVFLIKTPAKPKPSNPLINLGMLVLTMFSVLLMGAFYSYQGPVSNDFWGMVALVFKQIDQGLPFAVSLMAILLAHEFGHYLAARYHKTQVSLPYFMPLPLISPLGTMGAFIQIKEPPKNKRTMLDIGLAGPLAGLIVTIPVLIYGLATSQVHALPPAGASGFSLEGNSILYLLLKFLVKGQLLPAPLSYGDLHPFLYWVRYVLTSYPLPFGGQDVMMNGVTFAGWAGLLVTAMNLLPAGQLDGGHLTFVLFGWDARRLLPFVIGGLVLLGLAWPGWWLWVGLLLLLGRAYMEPLDQITPLDPTRRALAILGLIIFFLVFIPIPMVDVISSF